MSSKGVAWRETKRRKRDGGRGGSGGSAEDSVDGDASAAGGRSPGNCGARGWRDRPELLYNVARFIRGSFERFPFEWASRAIVPWRSLEAAIP